MKRILSVVFVVIFMATVAGCSKKTCESIADECDGSNDFEEACIDDYKNGGACRDVLKDLRECVEDRGCDDSCDDELIDMLDECDEIYDLAYYY